MKQFNPVQAMSFRTLRLKLDQAFLTHSEKHHPGKWQGVDISKKPEGQMMVLRHVHVMVPLNPDSTPEYLAMDVGPNMPWSEDHFQERVCGYPINPGVEWANWPWGSNAEKFLNSAGMFNHNYMERLWPRHAGQSTQASKTTTEFLLGRADYLNHGAIDRPLHGIRGEYGDLDGLVDLLVREPETRQAYIPLFFPEDTGIGDGGRKPCTLGYEFQAQDHQLWIYYPMRSCDYFNHFWDDIYMALRLGQWIIERASTQSDYWKKVKLGAFSMFCSNLHMFINDYNKLRNKHHG